MAATKRPQNTSLIDGDDAHGTKPDLVIRDMKLTRKSFVADSITADYRVVLTVVVLILGVIALLKYL